MKQYKGFNLDELTQALSAFGSFDQLLNAPGGYRPTIVPQKNDPRYEVLARAYNRAQVLRGDERRAYTGSSRVDVPMVGDSVVLWLGGLWRPTRVEKVGRTRCLVSWVWRYETQKALRERRPSKRAMRWVRLADIAMGHANEWHVGRWAGR